jgi:hypothetical protein
MRTLKITFYEIVMFAQVQTPRDSYLEKLYWLNHMAPDSYRDKK